MTSFDPGYGDASIKPVPFIRGTCHHVIENNFCNICRIQVPSRTKHCRYCNKCISGFDHHCKWLNNCVGKKNYTMFIVLISSIIYITGTVMVVMIVFVVIFITKTANTSTGILASNNSSTAGLFAPELNWRFIDMWTWFIVGILSIIVHLIVFGVTLHLYRFHVMLWKKGMTTYSYITNMRATNGRDRLTTQTLQLSQTGPLPNMTIGRPSSRAVGDSSAVRVATGTKENENGISLQNQQKIHNADSVI